MKAVASIAIGAVFLLVVGGVASRYAPFSPSELASILMREGMAVATFSALVYAVFFYKQNPFNKSRWVIVSESYSSVLPRVRHLSLILLGIAIFPLIIAHFSTSVLAYPSKWLAKNETSVRFSCVSQESFGKKRRETALIVGFDADSGERIAFPWPNENLPGCGRELFLVVRQGPLGIYVLRIQEQDAGEYQSF